MRSWGVSLRNGAVLGIGLLSVAAIYLFVTGQMTWLAGALIVGGVILCVIVGISATRVSAVMELVEESQQSESEIQRKLIDLFSDASQTSLVKLSEEVGVSVDSIASALRNLMDLGLFAGAVAWDSGVVYSRKTGYLVGLEACLHCDEPLRVPAGTDAITCPVCRTQHADILTPND